MPARNKRIFGGIENVMMQHVIGEVSLAQARSRTDRFSAWLARASLLASSHDDVEGGALTTAATAASKHHRQQQQPQQQVSGR
jgi:succinylarginine dihydrolase